MPIWLKCPCIVIYNLYCVSKNKKIQMQRYVLYSFEYNAHFYFQMPPEILTAYYILARSVMLDTLLKLGFPTV
jgi:hypothetical protein